MIVALLMLVAQDLPKGPPGPDEIDTPPPSAIVHTTASAGNDGNSWSIMPPDPCAGQRAPDHITVCGVSLEESQRSVFRGTGVVRRAATPSNPDVREIDALHLAEAPCVTRIGGCQVGVNTFSGATAAVNLVRKIFNPDSCCEEPGEATNLFKLIGDGVGAVTKKRKTPDAGPRVAVDLSDPAANAGKAPAGPAPESGSTQAPWRQR